MTEVAERPERDTSDHGGASDITDAWRILAGGAVVAARALREIASDPEAPAAARVTASKTILQSVGFGQDDGVKIAIIPREYDLAAPTGADVVSSAQIARDRMAQLRARNRPEPEDDDVVDAVLVDDPEPIV